MFLTSLCVHRPPQEHRPNNFSTYHPEEAAEPADAAVELAAAAEAIEVAETAEAAEGLGSVEGAGQEFALESAKAFGRRKWSHNHELGSNDTDRVVELPVRTFCDRH